MSFEQLVSTHLKRLFYQEAMYQPELFQVVTDPINVKYIYDHVVERIQKTIGFDDFIAISTETLAASLREPYRSDSLLSALSLVNNAWIETFAKRFASDQNGAASYYRKAVAQNFVQNPAEFQAPVHSSIHGDKLITFPSNEFTPRGSNGSTLDKFFA